MTFRYRDRVTITEDYRPCTKGMAGIVMGADNSTGFIAVQFKDAIKGGTDCKTGSGIKLTKPGHGAWLPARVLVQEQPK